jgi:hypothetical protein
MQSRGVIPPAPDCVILLVFSRLPTCYADLWHGKPQLALGLSKANNNSAAYPCDKTNANKMVEREPIPISWVCKEDFIRCRPDLSEQIQDLDAAEIEYMAEKIGDALQETYWLAMQIVLLDCLGMAEEDLDEAGDSR